MFPTDRDIMQENTINIMVRFRNKPHGLQQTVQSQDELTSNKLQETSRIRQGTVTYQITQAVYLHFYWRSIQKQLPTSKFPFFHISTILTQFQIKYMPMQIALQETEFTFYCFHLRSICNISISNYLCNLKLFLFFFGYLLVRLYSKDKTCFLATSLLSIN